MAMDFLSFLKNVFLFLIPFILGFFDVGFSPSPKLCANFAQFSASVRAVDDFKMWTINGALCSEQERGFLNTAPYYYYYTAYTYCAYECCGSFTARFCCDAATQTPVVSDGLSTGAIIGIAVGCAVAVIITVIVIVVIAKVCCPTKVKVLHTDEKTRLAIIGAEHRLHMRTQLSKSGEMDISNYKNFYMNPSFAKGLMKNQSAVPNQPTDDNSLPGTLQTTKLGDKDEVADDVPFWRRPGANPFLHGKHSLQNGLFSYPVPGNVSIDENGNDKTSKVYSSGYLDPNTPSSKVTSTQSLNVLPSVAPITTVTPLTRVDENDDIDKLLNDTIESKNPTLLNSFDRDEGNGVVSKKKSKKKKRKRDKKTSNAGLFSDEDIDKTDPYPVLAPLEPVKEKSRSVRIPDNDSDDDLLNGFTANDIFAPKKNQPTLTSNSDETNQGLRNSNLPPLPTAGKSESKNSSVQKPSYNDFGDSDNDSLFNGLL